MPDLRLVVDGRGYGGWEQIRVTRTIKSLAGSFDLDASDRWAGQDEVWPIFEEDACRVVIDGEVVIDGYVDKRSLSLDGTSRKLSYQGRDRTAALVDNSAVLKSWSFSPANLVDIAKKLAAPFGISVSVQAGLVLKPQTRMVVNHGDTPYQALERAATIAGVLLISDGAGGLVITRAGTARVPTALVQGENVLGASIEFDATDRFRRYVLGTQTAGTDFIDGTPIATIHAEAIDLGVRRSDRVLVIKPEHGMNAELARHRVDWEARVRAARSATATILVAGWQMTTGSLWPVNRIVPVHVPSIGIDGDLLISEAEYSIGDGGQTTQLRLVRPDAFLPEPKAVVKGEGAWKELKTGAKADPSAPTEAKKEGHH